MLAATVQAAPPPLKIWGNLNSIVRSNTSTSISEDTLQRLNTLTLSTSSYMWRPWFAIYSGTLGLTDHKTDIDNRPDDDNRFVTGTLNLNVFPSSRFPAIFNYEKNLSDTNLDQIVTDTNTSRYGWRQQYRDSSGKGRSDFSIQRSRRESNIDGTDKIRLLKFDYSRAYEYQKISVTTESNTRSNHQQNTRYRDSGFVARHMVDRIKGLSVESVMSLVDVSDENSDSLREIQANQISTFATWRSEQLKSLLVSGSFRWSSLTNKEVDVSAVELDSIAGRLSVNFDLSENVRFKSGLNASLNKNDSGRTRFESESASLSYNPSDIKLGNFRYNYGVGSAFTNRATNGENEQRVSASFSHGVNQTLELSEHATVWLSIDESFGASHATDEEKAERVTHSLSANWKSGGSKDNSMLRLMLSDSRSFGRDSSTFQMFNLQFNKETSLSRDHALSGNMTLQASKQDAEGDGTLDIIASGSINYRQRYLFNVPRLLGNVDVEVLSHGLTPDRYVRVKKDTAADEEGRLRVRLEYTIGQINLNLTSLLVYRDGDWDRAVQFQLNRSMGNRASL
jgi:hypothetical protein